MYIITIIIITSNVTGHQQGPKRKLRVGVACAPYLCGMWCPLVSVTYYNTFYYVATLFHRQVWYHALSLCYACI